MISVHQLLLEQVRSRIGTCGAVRQRRDSPFNIFTALRSSSDEVNLHSRFLHALLDHRQGPHGDRDNLRDFLSSVAGIEGFPLEGASIDREACNIDLLVTDSRRTQAVVIENKIWAADQERQLQRYHETLVALGYDAAAIHLLYLSPFGERPSKQSIGDLECTNLSYRDDLGCWLERRARVYTGPKDPRGRGQRSPPSARSSTSRSN